MPYVALKWDHRVGQPFVQWLVVECAGVTRKCGGPQAQPPRRDIAYFVEPATAERDAKAFAELQNRVQAGERLPAELADARSNAERHAAFPWDHNLCKDLFHWAVLEWDGNEARDSERRDVAYFVRAETAERDAKIFCQLRAAMSTERP